MDFLFRATSERSSLDVLYNSRVSSGRDVYSWLADIHRQKEKVTVYSFCRA